MDDIKWIDGRPTITLAAARKRGWNLVRGAHIGTSDDHYNRWYWDNVNSDVVDRRGDGYGTREEALASLAEWIILEEEMTERDTQE